MLGSFEKGFVGDLGNIRLGLNCYINSIHLFCKAMGKNILLGQRKSFFGYLLLIAYKLRILRPFIQFLLDKLEGGVMWSVTLRQIYRYYYGVELGPYSYWINLHPGVFESGTKIGNFSSFASGLKILRRNHPTNRISQHPFFFSHKLGLLTTDSIHSKESNSLVIGNDVWIGMDVIICPGCRDIGDGAIIGAGSVVTKNVVAYSIIGGNPAKLIRMRFPPEIVAAISASKWWIQPLSKLIENKYLFTSDVSSELLERFSNYFPENS